MFWSYPSENTHQQNSIFSSSLQLPILPVDPAVSAEAQKDVGTKIYDIQAKIGVPECSITYIFSATYLGLVFAGVVCTVITWHYFYL